eukprot:3559280-Alexandrium_andersonii.AAC.2
MSTEALCERAPESSRKLRWTAPDSSGGLQRGPQRPGELPRAPESYGGQSPEGLQESLPRASRETRGRTTD